MPRASPKRWLSPQSVPRGFLRLYILTALANGPESGYSIIRLIDERTQGAWRPGPGTIYPLLKSLAGEGLARPKRGAAASGNKVYAITPKGRRKLEEMRRTIAGMGRKEGVMGRLFSDLLPPELFVTLLVNRFREASAVFREKILQLPVSARDPLLDEYALLLESQEGWVRSHSRGDRRPPRSRPDPGDT